MLGEGGAASKAEFGGEKQARNLPQVLRNKKDQGVDEASFQTLLFRFLDLGMVLQQSGFPAL